jgi:hypothetical protein
VVKEGLHEPGRETFGGFCAPAFDELWDELHGPEYGACVVRIVPICFPEYEVVRIGHVCRW